MIAAVRVRQERFGALRRPFDRPLDLLRRPGADRLFVVDENLGAEAAADVGRDDAQLVLGRDALKRRQHDPREMRVLAGRVERDDIGAFVIVAERGARLHRVGDRAIVDEIDLGHVLRRGKRRVGRGLVAEMPVEHCVVGGNLVHLRLARFGGARRVDDRRQNAVIDDDLLRRVPRLSVCIGDDDGDGIADIERLAVSKRRKRPCFHRRTVLEIDCHAADMRADLIGDGVLAGEDRDHARRLQRGRRVDLVDRRMRVRRAQKIGVGLARTIEVVDVMALAGDEADVFRAFDGGANAGRAHECALPGNG